MQENARKYGKRIYVEAGKCWTYARMSRDELQPIRDIYSRQEPTRHEVSADSI